jgi:hypothetical protein
VKYSERDAAGGQNETSFGWDQVQNQAWDDE